MGRLRYDFETRSRMVKEMYLEGMSTQEIANELGYSSSDQIRSILRRLGFKNGEYVMDVPKVLALKKAGWSMAMIVDEFSNRYTATQIENEVEKWRKAHANRKY